MAGEEPPPGLLTVLSRFSRPVANGDFATTVTSLDIQSALNRDLVAKARIPWDNLSKELQANIRSDGTHPPGSDLFLVLDTGCRTDDELDPGARRWTRRAVMKLTWLKVF